jgi:hypothetical protein
MEARLIRRPAIDLLSGRNQCLLSLNYSSRRHESSYRRTKQRLNIKPDASFLSSSSSPLQDHIIFNPPSSAPSILHTPLKFLPKEDKRRQLLAASARSGAPSRLPPAIAPQKVPHHHLTDAQISEMQKLRMEDPNKWPNGKLARKYNCSTLFVTICLSELDGGAAYDARARQQKANLEAVKERWGPRRRMAREDRARRIELALGDQ